MTNKPFMGAKKEKTVKTIRRGVLLTDRMNEMAEKIAEKEGISTFTGVVEAAIRLMYSKTVENYKTLSTKNSSPGLPGVEIARIKVQKKQDEREAEQAMKDEQKALICTRDLYGDVEVDSAGFKYCVFRVHNKFESKESKVPLSQADPVIARSVFQPNRDTVLASRPELAKELGFVYDKKLKVYSKE